MIKQAMRDKDKLSLTLHRLVHNAISQQEKSLQHELDESAVLSIIQKMVKQGEQAAIQYKEGQRDDLYEKECTEVNY